ncbi:MAG: 30S ribosomal protein S12 methylthiotransferase RimO [Prevotellaceae bacterium]|jgi:ribosomal protein S12 methylthiotransferase|nr:30S ribosomal protein S12 methylthiotransferase RimO [Prevotellaceae bacterium]
MDISVITLGCSKNLVDSERLMKQLQAAGHRVTHDDATGADTVFINTCGFIEAAKEESIAMILSFVEAKRRGDIKRLYVVGCLSQRYRRDLQKEIPEVDAFFGVEEWDRLLAVVGGAPQPQLFARRLQTTPRHFAWLKIAEGCNWRCAYCAIPPIRGKYRSTPFEQLLLEATILAASGVKELLITAQDTTYYGLDLYGRRRLAELLRALADIKGVEWIRLHYAYPAQFPPDLIAELRDNPKLCKYLDIPLQHIADKVLKNMRRGIDGAQTRALLAQLRNTVPDIAIRTTLIVGHPGEDDAAFAELLHFVEEMRFERLGVFPYSEEEGTYAAQHLPDVIPRREKQRRYEEVMSLQSRISQELNNRMTGRRLRVLIDRREGDCHIARTEYDSPEVDNEVIIPAGATPRRPGQFCEVTITAAEEYDLWGREALPDGAEINRQSPKYL